MDTPIFDGVLGDRLSAARETAVRAGRDADRFRAALDAGQEQALEQLASQRAEQIVGERTSALTARVQALERQLRTATDERAELVAQLQQATSVGPEEPPGEAPVVEAVVVEAVVTQAPPVEAPVAVEAPPVEAPAITQPAAPEPVPARPAARKAADQGPTGEDVPAVPSMKDIFASTRAAGWLDSLLGAKR